MTTQNVYGTKAYIARHEEKKNLHCPNFSSILRPITFPDTVKTHCQVINNLICVKRLTDSVIASSWHLRIS